ncbi:FAD/FMN-containing dehydrogenase [Bradyrhizobiaceae bacterium SG-6C]|nr:FAD/FMN-containing dehydrogenase [Bradyrhizobiaceae bacterium SG-6C]
MRDIPSALQAKLDSGVTTLAHCWKLIRRDGVVQGFTDHDDDLVIDGVTCRAGTGFTSSEAASRFDLSVDGAEIAGALSDDALNESDLAAGRYDAADVETWLVDWSDVSLRVLMARSTLGEVKREGQAFSAELRGLADRLSQQSGRLFTARCSADLGDARCKFDLVTAGLQGEGAVESIESTSTIIAAGLDTFTEGVFSGGKLTWTSGANDGLSVEIKEHRMASGHARLSLWQAMPEVITVGDTFAVSAGCDKRFVTCRDRFANAANFRGFPHIPGNDFVIASPEAGAGNDGGSMAG